METKTAEVDPIPITDSTETECQKDFPQISEKAEIIEKQDVNAKYILDSEKENESQVTSNFDQIRTNNLLKNQSEMETETTEVDPILTTHLSETESQIVSPQISEEAEIIENQDVNAKCILDTSNFDQTERNNLSKNQSEMETDTTVVDPILTTHLSENESQKVSPQISEEAEESVLKKNYQRILDSDEENDRQVTSNADQIRRIKLNALIDSESEDESSNQDLSGLPKILDDNDDTNIETNSNKFSALVDSDSDSEISDKEESNVHANPKDIIEKKSKKPKEIRASAKKARDDMQAIQSEQQRLHREAHISIPYHKPKKYTLKEFLQRRTLIKPQMQNNNSPLFVPCRSLKMTAEELEEYAKLMDERAKEAAEFFKPESKEQELKDKGDILEINNSILEPLNTVETILSSEEPMTTQLDEETAVNSLETLLASKDIVEDWLDEITDTSKSLITEVLELPKLDLNSIQTSTASNTSKSKESSENFKLMIAEKFSHENPTIKGNSNMVIDLETGDLIAKEPTQADNLLQRLLATHKSRKTKTYETLNIISTENGKLEISNINVQIKEDDQPQMEKKPGADLLKLKENLKLIIAKKRREDMQKKLYEELEYNKCLEDDDEGEMDEYENEYDPENKPKKDMADYVIDEQDEELHQNPSDAETSQHEKVNDDHVTIETDGEDSTDQDEHNDNDENCQKDSLTSKRKSRIIRNFQDDSDDEEKTFAKPTVSTLFDPDPQEKQTADENELLGLCSGKFVETQEVDSVKIFISQIPSTQNHGAEEAAEELLQLCSGNFVEASQNSANENDSSQRPVAKLITPTEPTHRTATKIISTDDEEPNEGQVNDQKRSKKFTKKIKKTKVKLGFSDDEDVTASDEEEHMESGAELVEHETAAEEVIPETFIDYDSEENEIEVQMTKNYCVKQAQKFIEKEAELSESEWGSADEEENHMDDYENELGDEDEFDREKLRDELGKIHARKMLDEDIREVRKLQEMFFEDEENDGVGRQRQFKWKNAESGFSLDDGVNRDEDCGEQGESGDEENEQMWRKIRFEREQLLKEQELKNSHGLLTATTTTARKLNIITARKTTSIEEKRDSPFLISKFGSTSAALQRNTKTVRGSFLDRDKETLNKLASLTKGRNGINEADGPLANLSTKSKNFVFTTITVEEHENLKRKADDLINNSSEHGINYMKKLKIVPRRDKCLIDQLL